jgi:hypothetical protein
MPRPRAGETIAAMLVREGKALSRKIGPAGDVAFERRREPRIDVAQAAARLGVWLSDVRHAQRAGEFPAGERLLWSEIRRSLRMQLEAGGRPLGLGPEDLD